MNDLTSILQASKAIMDKTKTLPRNRYSEQTNGFADIDKDLHGVQLQNVSTVNEGVDYSSALPDNNLSDFTFSESAFENSEMPVEILNAMRESAKDRQKLSESVISKINPSKVNKPKVRVTEDKVVQNSNNSGAIDYSLIKTIIDESVRKHIGSLKKNMINESKGSSLELMTQQGNTFRFVTSDGKIFEGKLTYKGNIKEK